MVLHACNPTYSGGGDQKNLSSMSAWAKNKKDPHLNKARHDGSTLQFPLCRSMHRMIVVQGWLQAKM
jgi:hypothetical protein